MSDIAFLAIGVGIGSFGTLVGAGGGFLLVPILALLEPTSPPSYITAVSLAVVAMNAGSGAIAYARQRRIDLRSGVPFALATLPGSIVGVALTRLVSRQVFDFVFAVVLMALAVFVLIVHKDDVRSGPEGGGWGHVQRTLIDSSGTDYRYRVNLPLGIGISLVVGLASSFLGIGGGVIHVPALIGLLDFPAHIATATSHFVLAIMASVGTIAHIISGDLDGMYRQTAVLGVGAIIGAQIGAHLSRRVRGVIIVRILAASLLVVGLRLAIQALTAG